ncbi:MAG: hypothetical protein L3K26_05330, partial [Candidatus Hydrogenedentes bacterium]|nr:hypothetical protein [Candidatus Hydrogenedentota bacterium]
EIEACTGKKIGVKIKDVQDFRNYKVTCDRARTYLGFQPEHSITGIVHALHERLENYGDLDQEGYSNIAVFKKLNLGVGG